MVMQTPNGKGIGVLMSEPGEAPYGSRAANRPSLATPAR
jgi:hypothetical protein